MEQRFNINQLRVASPCQMAWAEMAGDERVRHCDDCRLNVYNTAEMTRAEVERMVMGAEGRVCIRMYRRADGTVLTRDCPAGLRAYARRVSRLASAAAAAVLAFAAASFGQDGGVKATDAKVKVTRSQADDSRSSIQGLILDVHGAVIPDAKIELMRDELPFTQTASNDEGKFDLGQLIDGQYTIKNNAATF
jgi:hypothetical protein